ncbi:MAG: DUF2202 domain-containing protein [Acholeplasma sp.]|jgi:hypothetical protein|nr:DUF2202 domain-containing protein [Acholeplasma sp.]
MKKSYFLGLTTAVLMGAAFIGVGLSAAPAVNSVYNPVSIDLDETGAYDLEEMLTYAIYDEYLAKATYEGIINTFGEIKPFTRIVEAEETHISLLLPLFETYSVDVPVNDAASYVVVPDSVSSALATGVEAEKANIAIYQSFLAQDDLPDDVRVVFEQLMHASENHLRAFSRDRVFGAGYDLAQQLRNRFGQGNGNGKGNRRG